MTATIAPPADAPFRYLALADWLAVSLKEGRFPPGSRLPSVRELCEAHGASLATVMHALHRLEDAGLIEARPRQGFFARADETAAPEGQLASAVPEVLDSRRERLMALAASQSGYLSLGHLALPDDLLPLPALRKLCQRQLRGNAALSAATVAGSELLREQVAQRLNRRGCRVAAEDMVVTHGEGEALQLCLGQLTQAGDRVAVTRPVPLRALELLRARGVNVVELPAAANGEQVVVALAEMLRNEGFGFAACIVDIATSAASGTLWDDDACRAMVALCTKHALPLIECDLFGELSLCPEAPQPLKAFDHDDRVLHCGGMACVTGIGFNLGWVASGRHRLQLRAARAVHGELVPALTDGVIADFLGGDDMDRHLRRLRRQLARRATAWTDAVVAAFPTGTQVNHGPLGHQLWITLPKKISALDLLTRARSQAINFVPGSVFTTGADFDHCLRLACAHALDGERLTAVQLLGQIARLLAEA